MSTMGFNAKVENVIYRPTFSDEKLEIYEFENFDVNKTKKLGIIKINNENAIAFARWTGPKRTRTYPLALTYDIYSSQCKRVALIPIIKDEGVDGDLDRINSLTLTWLNLLNVYIILVYYVDASPKLGGKQKIENKNFDKSYVNEKINEILSFQLDAHHWNKNHFENEYDIIFRRAVSKYEEIEKNTKIKLHDRENDIKALEKSYGNGKFSLEKYIENSTEFARQAANREVATSHFLEKLSENTTKATFNIRNSLGGTYHLTCDECFWIDNKLILQESKNTTSKSINKSDIKDGLFKLILLSNIDSLYDENKEKIPFESRLYLSMKSDVKYIVDLPITHDDLLCKINEYKISNTNVKLLEKLNKEAELNNISIRWEAE